MRFAQKFTIFASLLFFWCLAALSFYQVVRNDNLGGGHIWMLNQVDELAGRLHPQLAGVDVDGGQGRIGQLP